MQKHMTILFANSVESRLDELGTESTWRQFFMVPAKQFIEGQIVRTGLWSWKMNLLR